MSSVYATEPSTSGRVIFETIDGPLEIHLWCRECPSTTRLFLQLCLDGFYDGMLFHRVVSNFLIQTGAIRHADHASSNNGQDVSMSSPQAEVSMGSPQAQAYRQAVNADAALARRQYELNARIRFNHRGQVAMALGVDDNDDVEDLQPQFLITLEDASYLDGKHVVFGTVSGPTIFNALRIGRTEVDENTNQPLDLQHATRIKSVKIVENPIHDDLVPQTKVPWRTVGGVKSKERDQNDGDKKKKKKRQGKLDKNVLSFGAELEEEEHVGLATRKGMVSSHDVVDSKVLGKQVDQAVKEAVLDRKSEGSNNAQGVESDNNSTKSVERTTPQQGFYEPKSNARHDSQQQHAASSASRDLQPKSKPESLAAAPKSSFVEARRAKYTKGKKNKKEREEETLAKLIAFRSTVQKTVEEKKASNGDDKGNGKKRDNSLAARMARRVELEEGAGSTSALADQAPSYHGQVLECDDDDDGSNGDRGLDDRRKRKRDWLATSFKCRRHVDHESKPGLGGDGRHTADYEVMDSRGRKEKRGHKHHHHQDKMTRKHQDRKWHTDGGNSSHSK